LVVGAVACVVSAAQLAVLAADVAAWRTTLPADDVRYRVDPEREGLWAPELRAPWLQAGTLLGVHDDVEFRDAVRALRAARLEEAIVSDPETAVLRNVAHALLQGVAIGDEDRSRASRAAGLLGVLGLARLVTETQDRDVLLGATIATLRAAVELDASNDEAKYNLELALQRARGLDISEAAGGRNAAPGGQGMKGAGAGEPGGGY
jgi:hypothetical protein